MLTMNRKKEIDEDIAQKQRAFHNRDFSNSHTITQTIELPVLNQDKGRSTNNYLELPAVLNPNDDDLNLSDSKNYIQPEVKRTIDIIFKSHRTPKKKHS